MGVENQPVDVSVPFSKVGYVSCLLVARMVRFPQEESDGSHARSQGDLRIESIECFGFCQGEAGALNLRVAGP